MDKLLYFPAIDKFGEQTSHVLHGNHKSFEKRASKYDYAAPVKDFLSSVTPDTDKFLYMLLHALGASEMWGCFLKGAPVLMSNGYEKPIEDVEVGDRVITHTGSSHKVLKDLTKKYDGMVRTFNFRSWGSELKCTAEHPVFGVKGEDLRSARKEYYTKKKTRKEFIDGLQYDFFSASELKKDDYVCIPFKNTEKKTPELGGDSFAYIMGWYLAEGCLTRNYSKPGLPWTGMVLVLGGHEEHFCKSIQNACEDIGASFRSVKDDNCIRISIIHRPLVNACLKHLGRGSRGKYLSSDIMSMPAEWKKIFLGSYLAGDGSQVKSKNRYLGSIRSSTASRMLASGLCKLTASIGLGATFFKCKQHDTSMGAGNTIYENSYDRNVSAFLDRHKFFEASSSKNDAFNHYIDLGRGYILVPINSIVDEHYSGGVFNLHVESDNSYVINGIAVHNSNVNGDAFEEWALKHDGPEYGHKTFESQAKLYKHHVNKDPLKSYGDVLHSHYDDKMKRVLLVVAVDRNRAPDICNKIELCGEYPDVSMGCKVPYDVCSICGNKAKSPKVYCDHAKYEMNKIYPDGRKVFVKNPFPRFFDISQVFIGAEKPAKFLHRIKGEEMGGSIKEASRRSGAGIWMPSAMYAEKIGYSTKSADMIKEVPAGEPGTEADNGRSGLVMQGLSRLRAKEKTIPMSIIGHLAKHPLKKTLCSLTSMGIGLKPEEFQNLVLIRKGEQKLASILDSKKILFKVTDESLEVEPIEMDPDYIDQDIVNIAEPYMADRSDNQPFLMERILRETSSRSSDSSAVRFSRVNVAPVMASTAALFMAYKKGLLSGMGPIENVIEDLARLSGADKFKNPASIIPLTALAAAAINGAQGMGRKHGDPDIILDSDIMKTSGLRDLALVGGLIAAPYVGREHVINRARRGKRPGALGSVLYKYPEYVAAGAMLMAPVIANKAAKLKGFVNSGVIGKMFKMAYLKPEGVTTWFDDDSCSGWKDIYHNVVKSQFWETNKIAHFPAKSVNIVTVLGLAEMGSKED